MISRIRRYIADTQAHHAYFRGDRYAGRLLGQLAELTDPADRVPVLNRLAQTQAEMARAWRSLGPDPNPYENGRDLSDSMASAAQLVELVADAEAAAASGRPRERTDTHLEPYAGPVLDRMSTATDPAVRGALLDDLYVAVLPVVGGQAAEVVGVLPAPGHYVPHTLRQIWNDFRAQRAARQAAAVSDDAGIDNTPRKGV